MISQTKNYIIRDLTNGNMLGIVNARTEKEAIDRYVARWIVNPSTKIGAELQPSKLESGDQ